MTRQTSAPLEHLSLDAADRQVRELVRSFINDFGLDLQPPYQRDEVWTEDQKIALVRSWMLGLPTGVVIFNDRTTLDWEKANGYDPVKRGEALYACIDGQQRITAGRDWFEGELAVPASWFDVDDIVETEKTADGLYVRYTGLTLPAQRKFANRAHLTVSTAKVATVEQEAEIFLLVNGGGTPQTSEDMANAARIAKEGVIPAPATEQVHPMELEPGDHVEHPTMGEVEVLEYPVKHLRDDGTAYATTDVHQRGTSLRGNAVWPLPNETPEES